MQRSGTDVIIPVYGAAADLRLCLESVAAHTDLARHRVLLVIDGPQGEEVESLVRGWPLLRNERRLGFTRSVNRGMRATAGDVVLLNSDAIVSADWLEKMIEAAYARERTGTVTPLSNNATVCSVPRGFAENLLPAGHDVASFAALVGRVSARSYPAIPTGVGFCLYIRRALFDEIGLFDEERFPLGYGEENDFCLRASDRGWQHVADDATFVYHAGHRSFGAAREKLAKRGIRKLPRRFMETIAELMVRDPLAPVRARITTALRGAPSPAAARVAHLVHGWPPFAHGGTELYAYWLVMRQLEKHDVAVYARIADPARAEGEAVELCDRGARVRLVTNNFTSPNPLRRNAIRSWTLDGDFERFLREERPDLLHVHHLAGHTFSLVRIARRLGIPIVMQLQDWWFLCARVNLLHRDGSRCSGPAPAKCAACVTLTRRPANRVLHALRRSTARATLASAAAFIAGSNAIREDYASLVPPSTPFHVIPYGIAIEPQAHDAVRRPVRFGCVGSVAPHKGVHVAVEAIRGVADATLHVWGDTSVFADYALSLRGPQVVFEGTFCEEEKARVYASMDVLIAPSIGLESFGLAAREAMACGVPVIASAGGAMNEAPECELFPVGDVAALRAIVRCIVDDPAMVDRWRERLPRPKHMDVHAEEIEDVYRAVLR